MNGENQIAQVGHNLPQQTSPQQATVPTALNQYGDDSTQIAYVQNYAPTVNQTVIIQSGAANRDSRILSNGFHFDYDCFNLFVIGAEEYKDPWFLVPKDRALTESTSPEMKERCASLSPDAVETIKSFPALFCSENHNYTRTDPDHIAYYGYVLDIKMQDNGIKVYFRILNELPQQALIDLSEQLCIGRANSFTELCRTHWAIKRVNLVEVLQNAGYPVFRL